ncbi:MAG TPA: AAA family ATPase [Blastocatellia bacterium]|nr:AAA family ATPase [Blastocatellia bacterium]
MYTDFYKLNEIPFGLSPDPKYVFRTESYLEVMANLEYAVDHCKGIVAVTGEVGTGKTTILRCAMKRFTREVASVYIFNPFLTVTEFFDQFTGCLSLGLQRSSGKPEVLDSLGRLLAARHSRGLRTVLILDEAHGLPTAVLEEVRLLANFETNSEKLLQIILCGQPELREVLNLPRLRQLKQRISLRCKLKPLLPHEVNSYIRFRLKVAGAERVDLFEPDATALIARVSSGIPRIINNICDNALLYGCSAGSARVTRALVEEVVETLDLEPSDILDDGASSISAQLSATAR